MGEDKKIGEEYNPGIDEPSKASRSFLVAAGSPRK